VIIQIDDLSMKIDYEFQPILGVLASGTDCCNLGPASALFAALFSFEFYVFHIPCYANPMSVQLRYYYCGMWCCNFILCHWNLSTMWWRRNCDSFSTWGSFCISLL